MSNVSILKCVDVATISTVINLIVSQENRVQLLIICKKKKNVAFIFLVSIAAKQGKQLFSNN